jgi:predicted nuclease of predicted toxin-antitoxin system
MVLWIDAQLSPELAHWLTSTFGVQATAVRDLGLREAEDTRIFTAARNADAVVLTKDADFPNLLARLGAPPRVIWLRCGNTSNAMLRTLLVRMWPDITAALDRGDVLIEIRDTAKQAT